VIADAERERLKAELVALRGTWGPEWDAVLELDPEYLRAFIAFAAVPATARHLDDATRALVALAVDAAVTHLHAAGVREHIRAALAAGATRAQVMEVLECTSTLAIHAMNVGVPVLVEVLAERGIRTEPAPPTERQEQLKADFTAARGYWNPTWDELLELDPELFAAYTDFSSVPWRTGTLSPKTRELVYIAFDTSSTHLYRVGLKLHIENALGYGATPEEILEVMEVASLIGMQSATLAAPILLEESIRSTGRR
jgi:alkylhydroperoxidase/carboxymuconolactone decarboxylase family protein YurZ